MSKLRRWQTISGVALAAATIFGSGCAQQVGDIDRTQPNKIEKKAFLDTEQEWYYRQTVVDSDLQGSIIFEGLQSSLKRVKWIVTENTLFACSTVAPAQGEFIEELQGEACFGKVAAFPITGHFDIQRQYSTATGEQSNVIVENTTDRPWFQRDYMRVDWSRNMIDGSGMFDSQIGGFAAASWNVPQDDSYKDPWRTRIKPDRGFIETTTMYTFVPDLFACYNNFGLDSISNCDAGELRMAHSFVKIPKEKTYEPIPMLDTEYITKNDGVDLVKTTRIFDPGTSLILEVECNDAVDQFMRTNYGDDPAENCRPRTFDHFTRFGYFRTQNVEYLEEYDSQREASRQYYANAHQIWQTAYDADGKLIPKAERDPKPIIYYTNPLYPRDAIAIATDVADQWDKLFLNTVATAQGKTTTEVSDKLKELGYPEGRMFEIRHNMCMPNQLAKWAETGRAAKDGDKGARSVAEIIDGYAAEGSGATLEDQLWSLPGQKRLQLCSELEYATEDRAAGERFEWERPSDLSKSYFYWVEELGTQWLGYGPSSADPKTGQIVSGAAHLAGTAIRQSAYSAADLIMWMNGELSQEDAQNGEQVRRWVAQRNAEAQSALTQSLSPQGKREFVRAQGADPSKVSPTSYVSKPTLAELPDFFHKLGPKRVEESAARMSEAARLAKAQDTRFQKLIEMPEVKSVMLADPQMLATVKALAHERMIVNGGELTQEMIDQAYVEMQVPTLVKERADRRSRWFSDRNLMNAADAMDGVYSLITYDGVANFFKGKPREEIAQYFLHKLAVGTQLHEVGHTVGLRHNFSASMDALNYHDEYWLIQKAILEGRLSPEQANSITDPTLVAEITGETGRDYLNEAEYRLASVMDYTGDLTGRFAGLGKYDQASINFVYGGMIQRWKKDLKLPNGLSSELFLADYTELPEVFSDVPAGGDPTARKLAGIDIILNGREWVPISQELEDIRNGIKNNTDGWTQRSLTRDSVPFQDRTVAYNFCSDERNDFQLGCDVWDFGSNHREIVNHSFNTWRWRQAINRHLGSSLGDDYGNYNTHVMRLLRTFDTMSKSFRYASIYRYWDLGSYTDTLNEAMIDGINFYSEMLAQPDPGRYCLYNSATSRLNEFWYYSLEDTYVPARFDFAVGECENYIDLRPGPANYYNHDFTDEYYYRIRRVGTFLDKSIAVQAFFNIQANYLFNEFVTDLRATNVSYWTVFQDESLQTMRGLILNDYSSFGGMYDPKTQGYVPPMIVNRDTFNHGVDDPQNGQKRIYNTLSFNHEFNTMAFGMIANSTWQDRSTDFGHYLKVAVDNTEVQEFGEGAQLSEFIHPVTFQRYVAPQTADGKSITVDIITHLNRLKGRYQDAIQNRDDAKVRYDQKREAYGMSFNPSSCLDTTQLEGDAPLREVCDLMNDYELFRDNVKFRSEQMEDFIGKLEQIRFLWRALDGLR